MTTFSKIIKGYGDRALVYRGGSETEVRCFIQPVMSASADKRVWSEMTELGENDTSRSYGFFPADAEMDGAEYVICGGASHDFIRCEMHRVLGKASHWEAVLKKREAAFGD